MKFETISNRKSMVRFKEYVYNGNIINVCAQNKQLIRKEMKTFYQNLSYFILVQNKTL